LRSYYRVCGGVDHFAALQVDRDHGDMDWCCDTNTRANLYLSFQSRLDKSQCMFTASVPLFLCFILCELSHVPVSPICQDIQLRNYYSGFPTPVHWLMPFAQSLSPHWALRPSLGASPAGIARQVGGREMWCCVRWLCVCVLRCVYSGPGVMYALAVGQSSAFV
jgi:hypothetical protein